MKSKNILMSLTIVSGAVVSGAAHADTTYTSLPAEHPFSLTLTTDSSPWQNVSSSLHSSDNSYASSYTNSTTTPPKTDYVPAKPGVAGSIDTYTETTTTTQPYTWNQQALSIGYSAGLAAPISAPETYKLTGQIAKQGGDTLYSSYGSLYFQMGLNVNFLDPYAPNSAAGVLTFKLSNTPGDWTYVFQTPFDTSADSITLNHNLQIGSSQSIDLNNPTFFEADYSINGSSSIQFGISNLSLNINGSLDSPSVYGSPSSVVTKDTLFHADISALPQPVPVPAAAWFFGSGLIGLAGLSRKRKND